MNKDTPAARSANRMGILPSLLVLAFGALQTVAFTDCSCLDFCAGLPRPEPGDCKGCDPGDEASSCVHLEPATDLASDTPTAQVQPPAALLLQAVTPELPDLSAFSRMLPPAVRPLRGRPLYLLHASLLL